MPDLSQSVPRIIGVHIKHPDANERAAMVKSSAWLSVDRGLKSGKLDEVPLTEDQLVSLIANAAQTLHYLRQANR